MASAPCPDRERRETGRGLARSKTSFQVAGAIPHDLRPSRPDRISRTDPARAPMMILGMLAPPVRSLTIRFNDSMRSTMRPARAKRSETPCPNELRGVPERTRACAKRTEFPRPNELGCVRETNPIPRPNELGRVPERTRPGAKRTQFPRPSPFGLTRNEPNSPRSNELAGCRWMSPTDAANILGLTTSEDVARGGGPAPNEANSPARTNWAPRCERTGPRAERSQFPCPNELGHSPNGANPPRPNELGTGVRFANGPDRALSNAVWSRPGHPEFGTLFPA